MLENMMASETKLIDAAALKAAREWAEHPDNAVWGMYGMHPLIQEKLAAIITEEYAAVVTGLETALRYEAYGRKDESEELTAIRAALKKARGH